MTALTHQLKGRTVVAAAVLAAAVLALIAVLILGISATSGHPGGSPGRHPVSHSQPVPGPGFRATGCLICVR